MSDSKVYMFPEGGHDNTALWAMLANKDNGMNNPLATAAMMNGGMGGQWNNPLRMSGFKTR